MNERLLRLFAAMEALNAAVQDFDSTAKVSQVRVDYSSGSVNLTATLEQIVAQRLLHSQNARAVGQIAKIIYEEGE